MSNYPSKIDDVISLPQVKDKFTKITAETINRLRQAIINIETEMGIKPSEKYIDVKTRIDYLENAALNMRVDDSFIRVTDPARPGQTLIRNNGVSRWVPETNFIARSIKTSGQLESGLVNAAGFSNGLTILDGKMIFKGLSSPPEKSDDGTGAIYFDKVDNRFKFSIDGSPYQLIGNLSSINIQANFAAHQDLEGDYIRQKVIGIRTIPIKDQAPLNGQPLVYYNGYWVPSTNFGSNDVVTTGNSKVKSAQITSLRREGVIKSDAAGRIGSGLIFDIDVDANASIDGTKVVSDFGAQDVKTATKINADGYGLISKILLDSGLGPTIYGGSSLPTTPTSDKVGSLYIHSSTGTVYMYMGATIGWKLLPGTASGSASGELYGNYPNPKVGYLNGTQVIADGSNLVTNNTLQIENDKIVSKPIKLDGGSNYVVGVLPKTKQKPQKMGSDVDGYTDSAKVIALQGVPVVSSALQTNSCLVYDASLATPSWVIKPVIGTVSLTGSAGGDLDGYYPDPIVNRINGASIKTKSDIKNINEIFLSSGASITINGISSVQTAPSVFAIIPMRSFNINLTISNSSDNVLQVFSSDGYHLFGDLPSTPGSYWSNYGVAGISDINSKVITKSNEFDFATVGSVNPYNASNLQSPGAGTVTSAYASVSGGQISYSTSGNNISFQVSGKLKKSIILIITSKTNTPAVNYGASCDWSNGYVGNIIPRKGYILQSTGTTSPHLIYKQLDLSSSNIMGLLPSGNQEIMQMVGDVEGYTNNSVVKKIRNVPININSASLDDGYVFGLKVIGSGNAEWQAYKRALGVSPTGPASGNLGGNYDDLLGPKVLKLNGIPSDPIISTNKQGQLFGRNSATSAMSYYGVNLSDSSVFQPNSLLSASRQSEQTFGSDVSGNTGASPTVPTKVIRLNGIGINAPTAANNNNVLKAVSSGGVTSISYVNFTMQDFDGYFFMSKRNPPPVSSINTGTIYFDSADNCFKISEGGNPYKKLLPPNPSVRKIRKVPVSSNSAAIAATSTDDVILAYSSNNTTSTSLSVTLPSSADPNVSDKKAITISAVGFTSGCGMTFSAASGATDIITVNGTVNKSSVTFILDKSSSPAKWFYIDSGS